MEQYKKLFKMQYAYYIVCGLVMLIAVMMMMYNHQESWVDTNEGEHYIMLDNGETVEYHYTKEDIKHSLVNAFSGFVTFNWAIIIGLFVLNLLKSISRINRKTIEFMAALPVNKVTDTVFGIVMDSMLVMIIGGCMYLFERIYVQRFEECGVYWSGIKESVGTCIIVMIASDILIVTIIGLLRVVTSNGILACVIAGANYISLKFILVDSLGGMDIRLYSNVVKLFPTIAAYWYENGEYHNTMTDMLKNGDTYKVIMLILAVAVILSVIAIYYSKRIDYSNGGLFYFKLPRYINLGIVAALMMVYLIEVFTGDYNIVIRIDSVAACVVGLFVINYYIAPRKIRNKLD